MEGIYTGTIAEGISTTMFDATRGYDKNGNIGYLKRTTGGGATVMDELIYSYTANQLTAVADGGDATKGFKDKVNTTDYAYDAAGNMTSDANKNLSIAYNHLNLPASITRNTPVSSSGVENNGVIKHYYAGASKVRMETYDAASTTLVKAYDYLAGMVYQETVTASISTKELDFVASPEGRAILTKKVLNLTEDPTTGDKFRFEYSLKDHLGNLRVSCRCGEPSRDQAGMIIPTGQPGAGIEPLAVVQEQHYDAWGLAFSTSNQSSITNNQTADRFTYNGKELVTDLDLGWNDYGFRMYDATIGRWSAVDLLSDFNPTLTPYRYCYNNPINYIDPNGLYELTATLTEEEENELREKHGKGKDYRQARDQKINEKKEAMRKVISELKSFLDENKDVSKVFQDFSGIKEGSKDWDNLWIENNRGPLINITNTDGSYSDGVRENVSLDDRNSDEVKMVTILHEYVHGGDRQRKKGYDATDNGLPGYDSNSQRSAMQESIKMSIETGKITTMKWLKGYGPNSSYKILNQDAKQVKVELGYAFERAAFGKVPLLPIDYKNIFAKSVIKK